LSIINNLPEEYQSELKVVFDRYKKKFNRTFTDIEIILMMLIDEKKDEKKQYGLIH
jgi:hypothetical protein